MNSLVCIAYVPDTETKIKIAAEDRSARDAMIAELIQRSDAALVQRIGHVAVLYRPSKDRRQIVLPRA